MNFQKKGPYKTLNIRTECGGPDYGNIWMYWG